MNQQFQNDVFMYECMYVRFIYNMYDSLSFRYCTLATTKDTRDWQPSPEYQLTKLKNSSGKSCFFIILLALTCLVCVV